MRNFFNKIKNAAKKAVEKINDAIDWVFENSETVMKVVAAIALCFYRGFVGI